jgi:hypothetical protein
VFILFGIGDRLAFRLLSGLPRRSAPRSDGRGGCAVDGKFALGHGEMVAALGHCGRRCGWVVRRGLVGVGVGGGEEGEG